MTMGLSCWFCTGAASGSSRQGGTGLPWGGGVEVVYVGDVGNVGVVGEYPGEVGENVGDVGYAGNVGDVGVYPGEVGENVGDVGFAGNVGDVGVYTGDVGAYAGDAGVRSGDEGALNGKGEMAPAPINSLPAISAPIPSTPANMFAMRREVPRLWLRGGKGRTCAGIQTARHRGHFFSSWGLLRSMRSRQLAPMW